MAWATSTRIGCAVADCQGKTFTVCRYKEEFVILHIFSHVSEQFPGNKCFHLFRGNIVGKQIYQVGAPCSACTTSCLGEGLCATP
ncbi:hypothetical protein Y032_0007g3491 [Ancylostoma ceylanicum]|nr:hypothetical protein Y032_0007g3491 [Ancylostoma ceylanicum]